MIHKDSNAYIYCMYGLKYDKKHYDAEHNKYYYNIPWRYIEPLWQGDDTELIVIKNTSVFINKFQKAASKINIPHAYGKVFYDLKDKLINAEYIDLAIQNGFETVFHKLRDGYEIQKEVRFAVKCNDKPDHFELQLENDQKLQFLLCSLKYSRDIMVELSDLEFDEQLGVPVRFSSEIKIYESN